MRGSLTVAAMIRPSLTVRTFPRRVIDATPVAETPERGFGLTTIIRPDGETVDIAAIASAEQGRAILDEIDEAILGIEGQLATYDGDPEWRRKAQRALKVKKLQRPRVQERIGLLKANDKSRAHVNMMATNGQRTDAKRGAFVKAAYDLLGHARCAKLWAHAQQVHPDAFRDEVP